MTTAFIAGAENVLARRGTTNRPSDKHETYCLMRCPQCYERHCCEHEASRNTFLAKAPRKFSTPHARTFHSAAPKMARRRVLSSQLASTTTKSCMRHGGAFIIFFFSHETTECLLSVHTSGSSSFSNQPNY